VRFSLLPLASVTAALALAASPARAEPTTWLAFGGGFGFAHDGYHLQTEKNGIFSELIGVGTSPAHALILGGVFRTTTYFTLGTDISLSARLATQGYVRGDWGAAFDLGVAGRFWKQQDYGHFPLQGVLTLGAPYGLQLALGTDLWDVTGDTPTARSGFAVIEIDLLRLTSMRSGSTTKHWPSPSAVDAPKAAPDEPPPP
jgi:hypothetical protein